MIQTMMYDINHKTTTGRIKQYHFDLILLEFEYKFGFSIQNKVQSQSFALCRLASSLRSNFGPESRLSDPGRGSHGQCFVRSVPPHPTWLKLL